MSKQDERERALVRAGWNDPHAMKTVDRMIAEVDAEHPRDPWRAFADFFDAKAKWSRETFGPGDRLRGVLAHIRKELSEIEREPSDIEEWIDVVMLAMDGAWRVAGADGEAFVSALLAKHEKNIGRIWPDWRTASNDAPIEHDRALDRMHPRPATDAAAVRAECARVLRKASQVADDNGLRGLSGSLSRDADRIEAAHPQAEPVTDWRQASQQRSTRTESRMARKPVRPVLDVDGIAPFFPSGSPWAVRHAWRTGALPSFKIGRRRVSTRAAVAKFLHVDPADLVG